MDSKQANLVLFLGSSIGNYNVPEREQFLNLLHDSLNHGDYVLIGFDLIKNPNKMLKAYDDSAGITREFNLNVLRRMNKELNANFNIENFQYIPIFNHHTQAIESYLISLKNQLINIEALQKEFYLKKHEKIHMENSHKFYIPQIHHMAQQSGFRVIDDFLDEQGYFVDSLWQVT